MKRVIKAATHKLIVNSVCPRNTSHNEKEYSKNIASPIRPNSFVCKRF